MSRKAQSLRHYSRSRYIFHTVKEGILAGSLLLRRRHTEGSSLSNTSLLDNEADTEEGVDMHNVNIHTNSCHRDDNYLGGLYRNINTNINVMNKEDHDPFPLSLLQVWYITIYTYNIFSIFLFPK
jgi:hypothetical protein